MLQSTTIISLGVEVVNQFNREVTSFAEILGIPPVKITCEPSKIQSFNGENYDCLLAAGDNIRAMLSMAEMANNTIDFCYIDPPYNTGQNFVYDDNRLAGQSKLWGKHEDWMSFMLPRIVLLKSLLKSSGIVAISIDDYEYQRLKAILDVVFGEENHIATLIVMRSKNGKGSKSGVSVNHDYVVIFGKSRASKLRGMTELMLDQYDKRDQYGCYKIDGLFRKKGDASLRSDRPNMFYPLYYSADGKVFTENTTGNLKETFPIDSKGIERRWLWGIEKARSDAWKLYASKSGVIYVKNYLTEGKRIKVKSIWDDSRYLTERATNEIKEIFGAKVFETPKPIGLMEDLIECCTGNDSLILDFFAGTGTTAHAMHLVNQKDSGKRKIILVESNTETPPNHIARDYGLSTISAITEARLKYIKNLDASFSFKSIKI